MIKKIVFLLTIQVGLCVYGQVLSLQELIIRFLLNDMHLHNSKNKNDSKNEKISNEIMSSVVQTLIETGRTVNKAFVKKNDDTRIQIGDLCAICKFYECDMVYKLVSNLQQDVMEAHMSGNKENVEIGICYFNALNHINQVHKS